MKNLLIRNLLLDLGYSTLHTTFFDGDKLIVIVISTGWLVGAGVGVVVGVGSSVGVAVGDGVSVGSLVGVGVLVGSSVGVALGVSVADGVAVGPSVGSVYKLSGAELAFCGSAVDLSIKSFPLLSVS